MDEWGLPMTSEDTTGSSLNSSTWRRRGEALSYEAATDSPALLSVRIDGGRLVLDANDEGAEGVARVTVTAMDPYGQSTSRTFSVTVEWVPAGHMRNWRLEWMRSLRQAVQ